MANSSVSHDLEWVVKSHKKITYNVEGVGTVMEEMKVSTKRLPDLLHKPESEAFHNVYINQELVRQKNLITGEMIKSDAKYEPYSFLRGINTDPIPDIQQGGNYMTIQALVEELQKENGKHKN